MVEGACDSHLTCVSNEMHTGFSGKIWNTWNE